MLHGAIAPLGHCSLDSTHRAHELIDICLLFLGGTARFLRSTERTDTAPTPQLGHRCCH